MWSRKHAACVTCETTDHPHVARGLCTPCYHKEYRSRPEESARIRARKAAWWWQHHDRLMAEKKVYRERVQFGGNRQIVVDRAGGCCERCHRPADLVVHHKDKTGRGAAEHNNDPTNLEAICRACHINDHRYTELLPGRKNWRGGAVNTRSVVLVAGRNDRTGERVSAKHAMRVLEEQDDIVWPHGRP